MGFFAQLQHDINILDLKNLIFIALLFYVPFHFSKKAETLFFHLLYSFFGIYMLATMEDVRVIYDLKMLVGLGLLIPQIRFIIQFTKDTVQTIKMMTTSTYYFFITIYYKIIRFINWIKSTYIMLKTFFTTFSFKKENYFKQEQSSQRDYNYEKKHQKFYEEPKHDKQEEYTSTRKDHTEYSRFDSSDEYIVLGVDRSDSYKFIQKEYRSLLRKYHPDLNPDNIIFANEMTKKLNGAWEKVEKAKK